MKVPQYTGNPKTVYAMLIPDKWSRYWVFKSGFINLAVPPKIDSSQVAFFSAKYVSPTLLNEMFPSE